LVEKSKEALILTQEFVKDKNNEMKAIPELIGILDVAAYRDDKRRRDIQRHSEADHQGRRRCGGPIKRVCSKCFVKSVFMRKLWRPSFKF
jgi:hypothetical protein